MSDSTSEVQDFTSCKYGAPNEALQDPGDHESQNDSAYFNFAVPDGAGVVGGVIRVGMRPNEGYSEASVVMPRPDGGVVFHYARSPLDRDAFEVGSRTWGSGPLTLSAVGPTRRWRLSYEGDGARLVSDPRAFAGAPGQTWRASEPIACEFDFQWDADFPMHVLSPGGNLMPGDEQIAYGKNHYEQFGKLSGMLRLGDDEWELADAPSIRDHSWGPRIWESAPDQDFVSVYLDDGRRVVAVCNRKDGREDMHGVCWSPGASQPAQLTRYELRSDYVGGPLATGSIGWTFEADGEVIDIEGEIVGCMPLRVGKNPVRIAQTILHLRGDNPGHAKTDLTRPIAES
jgi:hypothetical protein